MYHGTGIREMSTRMQKCPKGSKPRSRRRKKERGVEGGKVGVRMKEARPREFQIRKEDAEKHGYARGCGGCSSWFRGLGRQPHTSGCREKIREAMKKEARAKLAEQKKEEFEQRVKDKMWRKLVRRQDKEQEKRKEKGKEASGGKKKKHQDRGSQRKNRKKEGKRRGKESWRKRGRKMEKARKTKSGSPEAKERGWRRSPCGCNKSKWR